MEIEDLNLCLDHFSISNFQQFFSENEKVTGVTLQGVLSIGKTDLDKSALGEPENNKVVKYFLFVHKYVLSLCYKLEIQRLYLNILMCTIKAAYKTEKHRRVCEER